MTNFVVRLGCAAIALLGFVFAPAFAGGTGKSEPSFLAKAMDSDQCQLDLAQKAAKSASREDVRKFADQLITDHKQLTKEILSLASDQKTAIATGISKEHAEATVKLMTLKNADFDREFLAQTVRNHENAIKLFESEGTKSNSVSTRAFAERTLPALRKHLAEAKALQAK